IGFEMFPRRVQKALDKWVAGNLSVAEFLDAADWKHGWSIDAKAYLPLFHFARMNKIPMVALNIDSRLRKEVSLKGFDVLSEDKFKGVTRPAEPSDAYLDYLMLIYKKHDRNHKNKTKISTDDSGFLRFVRGQQLWDRAMAQALYSALTRPERPSVVGIQALYSALTRPGRPLVVGIMGAGHIRHGYGVPHQLMDLGIEDVAMLLPWESNKVCEQLVTGIADAVFGVASYAEPDSSRRQRLGIRFEMVQKGARILKVEKGSVAETAGLIDEDIITEIAGLEVRQINDVIEAVKRQAPGTWLPLRVTRGSKTIEIIARFSPVMQ
ncbi:MAG: ChaN family lipoprotein, partial [Nitrosomonadaceae bacterium]